jgi:hypothetical protein
MPPVVTVKASVKVSLASISLGSIRRLAPGGPSRAGTGRL